MNSGTLACEMLPTIVLMYLLPCAPCGYWKVIKGDCARTSMYFVLLFLLWDIPGRCLNRVSLVLLDSLVSLFPSVLWHCWLGERKGIRPVKNWMLVCWWWWFDWSFEWLIVTTTSSILCFNKHRLTQVHPEKMAVKMERELAVTFLY